MTPQPRRDLSSERASDFEESPQLKITRLEKALADERRFSVKATRQLHRHLSRELRDAEKRVDGAEKRAEGAERRAMRLRERAERAEQELEALRSSPTWKAGRAVVAVPAQIKRRMGRT